MGVDARFPDVIRYADNLMITGHKPGRTLARLEKELRDIGLTAHEIEWSPSSFCGLPTSAPVQVGDLCLNSTSESTETAWKSEL